MHPAPRAALALVAGLALSAGTAGATIVPGGSLITQTWNAAGSPYQVMGDITVPSGMTLTIDAGTVVQFATTDAMGSGSDAARVELIVVGSLVVSGTSGSPVRFEGLGSTSTQAWYGLHVRSLATACALRHLVFRHALVGIRNESADDVLALDNVDVDDCTNDLNLAGGGAPAISGTLRASRVVGALSIPSGARLEHNGGPGGSVSMGLSLAPGSTYAAAVRGKFDSDRLFVTGSITLGATLALDFSAATIASGDSVILMINDGIEAVSGTFDGLPEGAFLYGGGPTGYWLSYAMGTINDVGLRAFTLDDVPPGARPGGAAGIASARPNPARDRQTFSIVLPAGVARAEIEILDLTGRRVWSAALGGCGGTCEVAWDGRDAAGRAVPPGLYLARVNAGGEVSPARHVLRLR